MRRLIDQIKMITIFVAAYLFIVACVDIKQK